MIETSARCLVALLAVLARLFACGIWIYAPMASVERIAVESSARNLLFGAALAFFFNAIVGWVDSPARAVWLGAHGSMTILCQNSPAFQFKIWRATIGESRGVFCSSRDGRIRSGTRTTVEYSARRTRASTSRPHYQRNVPTVKRLSNGPMDSSASVAGLPIWKMWMMCLALPSNWRGSCLDRIQPHWRCGTPRAQNSN